MTNKVFLAVIGYILYLCMGAFVFLFLEEPSEVSKLLLVILLYLMISDFVKVNLI